MYSFTHSYIQTRQKTLALFTCWLDCQKLFIGNYECCYQIYSLSTPDLMSQIKKKISLATRKIEPVTSCTKTYNQIIWPWQIL